MFRQAEVGDLEGPPQDQHQVRRFYVSVDEAAAVCIVESRARLDADIDHLLHSQQLRSAGEAVKPDPLDVLHGDVGLVLLLSGIVDRHDAGVMQLRRRSCLPEEPLESLAPLRSRHGAG